MIKNYLIVAYYLYTPVEDPHEEVRKHHAFLGARDVRSRIYISHEGINGEFSALREDAEAYMEWLKSDPHFAAVDFKVDEWHEHVMPRLTIKFRKQLVALDVSPDMSLGGTHVSAEEWRQMLQQRDEDTVLIDVRNDYESKVGHFEGAILPQLESFRQFPEYAAELKEKCDPKKTKVMMYCTGGIRCEIYSALLKENGFEQVYQLSGGVIRYGQDVGGEHWHGKLFVFDDRLSVPVGPEEQSEVISCCKYCSASTDSYYNCANMDCNELFLLCPSCAEKMRGCCSEECRCAERLRPFDPNIRPKPFKKWYHYT